jgi:sec-independent protein translocase protein TatB
MLNLSPEKVLLLLVVALIVLGPNRLPAAARSVGRVVANLRRMSAGVQAEFRDALAEPQDALQGAVSDLGLDSLRASIAQTVNPLASPPAIESPPASPVSPVSPAPPTPAPPVTQDPSLPPAPDDPALN